MRLPDTFLETLKASNDIVEVISSFVELKRSGRSYSCTCPFHSERTPSFHVFPDTQSFFCFGCSAGGDVITFIRNIEHLDYIDSVKFLAQRAGLSMPEEDGADKAFSDRRQRLFAMNKDAAMYFIKTLMSDEGKPGLDYLINRGLSMSTIKRYGLGFAPDGWHNLHYHLRSLGYSDIEMEEGALISRKNNSVYDKFRNRVMFPIINLYKEVIAFGGRTLEPNAPAKYLNSDETIVFHKRDSLFSLNFAKNSKEDSLILCEGYMDVIALNQAGFDNAVATLGTAITPQQVNVMKRYAKEVIISYDSDSAGQKAAVRAINLLGEAGITARVLKIPDAKDPDEYIKNYGAESFRAILMNTSTALDYEFQKLRADIDIDSPAGKSEYLKRAVRFLAGIRNDTDRTVYITETAKISGQQTASVKELVKAELGRNERYNTRNETRQLIRNVPKRDNINPGAVNFPVEEKAERGIIAYIFHSPDKLGYIEKQISADDFPTEFNRRVFVCVAGHIKKGESIDISSIGAEFTAEETGRITGICRIADELPYSLPRLDEYISVLTEHRKSLSEKPLSELTDDELLERVAERSKKNKNN